MSTVTWLVGETAGVQTQVALLQSLTWSIGWDGRCSENLFWILTFTLKNFHRKKLKTGKLFKSSNLTTLLYQ